MATENRSYYYKYMITECTIIIPNKNPINLHDDNILGFTIEKDYDNDYFPIFNLQLNLTFEQYYTIIDNKTNVKFKVRLEKGVYDEVSTSSYKSLVFDTVFSIFIDDNSAFFDKELYNKTKNLLGSAENRSTYDFYLFKDSDIKSSKKVINRVIRSSNMTNCIVYLLSKSGTTNLLMAPLDNREVYNDIILPPVTTIQSLLYLEKQYGFYNHGSLFFYDFDTVYFINKRAECTAYRTGEFKEVIVNVFKAMNPNSKTPGNYKDTKSKTYILHVTRDNINMTTSSIINDQLYGTNVNIINTKNNSTTVVSPKVQSRNNTSTYISNNFGNKYLPKMIENTKYEQDNIIDVALTDIDISCFTPNKKYIFSFEEKDVNIKYKGNYRLSNALFSFIKNGEYYTINGAVQFKKTT